MNLIAGLLRHSHRAGLSHDNNFHFAGVGELVFDRLGDVAGEFGGFAVVDRLGVDDHADFAARLHGIDLVDTGEAVGDRFEVFQAADVPVERFAASPGTSG